MAKSAWKFFNYNVKDIYHFLQEYRLPTKYSCSQTYGLVKNDFKLNPINYMHNYKFYQGNTYVDKQFCIYNIGNKGYEFLKFTKPFYFRSKKKK